MLRSFGFLSGEDDYGEGEAETQASISSVWSFGGDLEGERMEMSISFLPI